MFGGICEEDDFRKGDLDFQKAVDIMNGLACYRKNLYIALWLDL